MKKGIIKYNMDFKSIIFFIALLSGLVGCVKQREMFEEAEPTIKVFIEELSSDKTEPEFTKLKKVLEAANRINALGAYNYYNSDGFTLFAPTDDAFDKFIENSERFDSFDDLLADKEYVTSLAQYHILNGAIKVRDFTYGTLRDTTVGGDYLTVVFSSDFEVNETTYLINGQSKLSIPDIELSNGIVHILESVLEPNVYTGYEWLSKESGLTIFTEALEKTGLADTMGLFKNINGKLSRNFFTLFVEPDSIFNKAGINSYDDLVTKYDNTGNVKAEDNGLYQFIAYHFIPSIYYLNNFNQTIDENTGKISPSSYNTYSYFYLKILSDKSIKINPGGAVIDTLYADGDTIPVNYGEVIFNQSNKITKTGPIHFVNQVMDIESNSSGTDITLHFREDEPYLQEIYTKNNQNIGFEISIEQDENLLKNISFSGVSYINYGFDDAIWDKDYISAEGDFTITYRTPNLVPGKYTFFLRHAEGSGYATVQYYYKDPRYVGVPNTAAFRLGAPIDCSRTTNNGGNPSSTNFGTIEVTKFGQAEITIDALRSGDYKLYFIRFTPQN